MNWVHVVDWAHLNWTAVAAFVAAGLSLLNVVVTAWIARRSQFVGWRRDRLYPLCLAFYKASRTYQPSIEHVGRVVDMRRTQQEGGHTPRTVVGFSEAVKAGAEALTDMKAQVAELELLGPADLAKAARQVVDASWRLDHAVDSYSHIAALPADRIDPDDATADDLRVVVNDNFTTARQAEAEFLDVARKRLGVRW